jgi:imidazolonepropionase
VLAWDGRIVVVGTADEVERRRDALGIGREALAIVDAGGGLVTPGLIDPHTHLLFGGTREAEVELRKGGAGYLEILEAGGGILQTVRATRGATEDELLAHGRRWLERMLRHGVTTLEAKSGYGLDTETELRLLRVAHRLGEEGPIEVVPTFLGAHAVAPEWRGQPDATEHYLASVIRDQLPAVAAQGFARFCDVFCEIGVFDAQQSRRVLQAAASLGLPARLHADELRPSGGAELAAELHAASADHLAAPSAAGIEALGGAADAGAAVVATLLPATTFSLMSDHYAPARALIERGVPVGLGSDFNPGTSPTPNLQLVLSIASLQLKLSPAEALAGVTINAARALGLEATHGSIEPGKQADLAVWDVPTVEQLPYWLGADLLRAVVKRGVVVFAAD